MSLGIGNSLEDALAHRDHAAGQLAATGLQTGAERSSVVLGTAMRYDIAEVVDPLVHIVAKIRKDALAGVKQED